MKTTPSASCAKFLLPNSHFASHTSITTLLRSSKRASSFTLPTTLQISLVSSIASVRSVTIARGLYIQALHLSILFCYPDIPPSSTSNHPSLDFILRSPLRSIPHTKSTQEATPHFISPHPPCHPSPLLPPHHLAAATPPPPHPPRPSGPSTTPPSQVRPKHQCGEHASPRSGCRQRRSLCTRVRRRGLFLTQLGALGKMTSLAEGGRRLL